MVRKISTGIPEYNLSAKTCGIVDERGEIAAMYKGVPQNDIGTFSDVIENSPKYIGMRMLIRSMAPEVIKAKRKIAPDADAAFAKGDKKSLPGRIFKALGIGKDDD